MLISGAASSCGPLGLKLRAIRQKERRDMKVIANKYRSVALALAVFAVAGTAPVAQSSGTWSAGISTRTGLPFRFVGDGDAADD
jgi:hypothetical protein